MASPHPLDNVIWQALNTRQAGFARIAGEARKFADEVGPLSGMPEFNHKGLSSLAELAKDGTAVALFLQEQWQPCEGWTVVAEAPLMQMVRSTPVPLEAAAQEIIPLGNADSADMMELTSLVKPSPFGPRTHELGNFFGIRDGEKLVAMAGERMKVPGHTEVSAVCTHPDHLGKGYAAALMGKVIEGIEKRGETPFLHVRADNDRAVSLYERLGFRSRWVGHFAALQLE